MFRSSFGSTLQASKMGMDFQVIQQQMNTQLSPEMENNLKMMQILSLLLQTLNDIIEVAPNIISGSDGESCM